jgi:hypothetical protein
LSCEFFQTKVLCPKIYSKGFYNSQNDSKRFEKVKKNSMPRRNQIHWISNSKSIQNLWLNLKISLVWILWFESKIFFDFEPKFLNQNSKIWNKSFLILSLLLVQTLGADHLFALLFFAAHSSCLAFVAQQAQWPFFLLPTE